MYCIKCGVILDDGEKKCPLCHTEVFHPDYITKKPKELYPRDKYPEREKKPLLFPILMSLAFLLPAIIVTLCDLQFMGGITWSGFVTGALLILYVSIVLPLWFKSPNPVVFVPCAFAAGILYLFYINLACNGHWFYSFALPTAGGVALIVCAAVTLMRYLKGGKLFIFGGAFILFGAFMLLVEFLMDLTFESVRFIGWSFYPLITFVLIGGLLVFIGCYRPLREEMERKFFV